MTKNKPVEKSIKEYSRGIIGGLLFSFPLLYTMEVWWAGYTVDYLNLLLFVFATYLLLLGYNRYAGMHPSVRWKHIFMESIEEMGLGLLVSFIVLFLINRIHLTDNISEIISKVAIEAMAVSIGVSIGTSQLGSSTNEEENNGGGENEKEEKTSSSNHPEYFNKKKDSRGSLLALIVLAFCGSVLVASSVGPTEEILMIAVQSEVLFIMLIAIISLLFSLVVSYYSNFKGTEKSDLRKTPFEITLVACLSYFIALVSSAFILWFFRRFENLSLWYIVAQCVVLGAVASLGASAARLLIK